MNQKELLEKGYFPKELPPPFQTMLFADNLDKINNDWAEIIKAISKLSKTNREPFKERFWESKWVIHSIPKVGFSRRLLGIPNPYHQSLLAYSISNKWNEIEKIFLQSSMSNSRPIKDGNKRALKSFHTFGEFRKECLIHSYDKVFEIRTDVSRYYGTIYTHIIPWIIHTKAHAKLNRKDTSLLGNLLDKNLRESNSGQTLGIPIGPDTSLVIAEIIGCTLDNMIQKKFNTSAIRGFRYIDDYYIYYENQADAEKVFKYVQSIFTEFQLEINEEKTKISKSPFPFEADWAIELGSFTFRKNARSQQTDIERFVSIAFKHAQNHPKESVLNFAIVVLKGIHLFDESWPLFQSLILKIAITEPVTLPTVGEILVSHKTKVDRLKIKSTVENIIQEHISKGHHFEVSWSLWFCVEFQIKLPNNIADLIFNSSDVVSIMIALDLKKQGLINSTVSVDYIRDELSVESLMSEQWLLTYEALVQDWIECPENNPIDQNEYFDLLRKYKVRFYDSKKRISPFKVVSPTSKRDHSVENNYNKPIRFSGGAGGSDAY